MSSYLNPSSVPKSNPFPTIFSLIFQQEIFCELLTLKIKFMVYVKYDKFPEDISKLSCI